MSCDMKPTEAPGPHYQGDVRDVLDYPWDLMIAHPPCTHLSVSGAHRFQSKRLDGRQQVGASFFLMLTKVDIPRYCIENPVGVVSSLWRKPDQIIQPYEFGHDASKATCLWLKGVPPLRAAGPYVEGDYVCECGARFGYALGAYGCPNCAGDGPPARRRVWANQTASGQNRLPPSETRAAARAETYTGIAQAMADQWGFQLVAGVA